MMKKRFIVCVTESTKERDGKFLTAIQKQGGSWWHWLENMWLIIDNSGNSTAEDWCDKARKIYPGNVFVSEISQNEERWAGYGPSEGKLNMFDWLNNNWHS